MHLGVCNIAAPKSGLEAKFSLRQLVAMALLGLDTASPSTFSDELAGRSDVTALRERIEVVPDAGGTAARLDLVLGDGRTLSGGCDVAIPERDLSRQRQRLEAKFRSIAEVPDAEAVIQSALSLAHASDVASFARLLAGTGQAHL